MGILLEYLRQKTACEVYSCIWVARSHGLFPVEFGGVVFEVGEGKKDSDQGLYFSKEIVHG